jgi:hypothetical protein
MSITHEEARRLIQFKADDALSRFDDTSLETHLRACPECQEYAASIRELESALPSLLHRRWNQHPLPLPAGKAVSRKPIDLKQNIFFATRIIAMGVICITFLFNIWQFTRAGSPQTNPPSAEIPMIPTPSAQSTMTNDLNQECEPIHYQVQPDDTLETIAKQFSVTADEILRANQLRTAALTPSMSLSIPACSPTPSGTPITRANAFTSLPGTTTLTPADGPTQ